MQAFRFGVDCVYLRLRLGYQPAVSEMDARCAEARSLTILLLLLGVVDMPSFHLLSLATL